MVNLMQGDCLELMKTIPDGSVDMVLTDPPYGTTACKWDSVIPFEPMWEQLKRVTKKNGAIVMTASQPFTSALVMSNVKMFKYCWVWDKVNATGHLQARRMPMKRHEDVCVFFNDGGSFYYPQGLEPFNRLVRRGSNGENYLPSGTENFQEYTNYPRSILEFKVEGSRSHPTQKPVALMEYLIKTYTNPQETVLDFTMGSGTTGVAAKNLNRDFIGIELDETYFGIAKQRIEAA
jgi:site-specific DNA-methyltransferase (adenine-specific)